MEFLVEQWKRWQRLVHKKTKRNGKNEQGIERRVNKGLEEATCQELTGKVNSDLNKLAARRYNNEH